jgi:hypothetical protein
VIISDLKNIFQTFSFPGYLTVQIKLSTYKCATQQAINRNTKAGSTDKKENQRTIKKQMLISIEKEFQI